MVALNRQYGNESGDSALPRHLSDAGRCSGAESRIQAQCSGIDAIIRIQNVFQSLNQGE